uniref:Uncharacterized protein n=1 Tax=Physcomitrium patens TaxID=3218 RepID=A0A2K1IID8_PHYPA|nr:hypothetical protein PHYPA_027726 [Physcomitrium patens]
MQIEICQEENKTLERMSTVEKLSAMILNMKEARLWLQGLRRKAAQTINSKKHELMKGRRTLERELAGVKRIANRVATMVAIEWKDGSDEAIPGWKSGGFWQSEMQQACAKLTST